MKNTPFRVLEARIVMGTGNVGATLRWRLRADAPQWLTALTRMLRVDLKKLECS